MTRASSSRCRRTSWRPCACSSPASARSRCRGDVATRLDARLAAELSATPLAARRSRRRRAAHRRVALGGGGSGGRCRLRAQHGRRRAPGARGLCAAAARSQHPHRWRTAPPPRRSPPRPPPARRASHRPGSSARRLAEQAVIVRGRRVRVPEVGTPEPCDHAPARRPLQQALLQQIRLVDVLDRAAILPDRVGQRRQPDRARPRTSRRSCAAARGRAGRGPRRPRRAGRAPQRRWRGRSRRRRAPGRSRARAAAAGWRAAASRGRAGRARPRRRPASGCRGCRPSAGRCARARRASSDRAGRRSRSDRAAAS